MAPIDIGLSLSGSSAAQSGQAATGDFFARGADSAWTIGKVAIIAGAALFAVVFLAILRK